MRVPTREIPAPPFPRELEWVNVASLRMDKQRGRPVLIEFWDFCRINSLRTMPYLKAWHERYAEAGLRVIGVHTGAWDFSRDPDAVRAAVARLGVPYPVALDTELAVWDHYGNQGWPARYLWDRTGALFSYHYGEGAYAETEREIGHLLDMDVDPVAPLRPEDEPELVLPAQTEDQPGAYEGPYEAGGVHAVATGSGTLTAGAATVTVDGPGVHTLLEHSHHTVGALHIEATGDVTVHATCFTPGVDPA